MLQRENSSDNFETAQETVEIWLGLVGDKNVVDIVFGRVSFSLLGRLTDAIWNLLISRFD